MAVVEKLAGVVVFLVLGVIVLRSLERFFPARDATGAPIRTRLFTRERLTDVAHVAFSTLVTQPVVKVAALVTFIAFVLVFRLPHDNLSHLGDAWHHDARLAALPVAVQAPLALLFADFASYWVHRAFHHGWLWRLHAVHHSSRKLDWLAGVRNHPLGEILSTMMLAGLLLVVGFDPRVLAVTAPLGLYAILLHANVSFGTSFARYIIATPLFHRWHHAHPDALPAERRAGVNFAGLFPMWDLLFGTFYAPRVQPASFGEDANVPPRFTAQLAFPFRRDGKA
jgi:sterol desaturase/sphingolipid hydroxylase (fatty acid hydroxylase superfamily)